MNITHAKHSRLRLRPVAYITWSYIKVLYNLVLENPTLAFTKFPTRNAFLASPKVIMHYLHVLRH